MPEGASQTFPMHILSILEHLRSNGCPSLRHNIPFSMLRMMANFLAGSDQERCQLIPTICTWSDDLEVDGWCHMKLLKPFTCNQQACITPQEQCLPLLTLQPTIFSADKGPWLLGWFGPSKEPIDIDIPTIYAWNGTLEVGRCQRKLLRYSPCT